MLFVQSSIHFDRGEDLVCPRDGVSSWGGLDTWKQVTKGSHEGLGSQST